jgi:predicted AAA+ superfamily ATPase
MRRRHLQVPLERALADTPVVLVNGARQVGKTTLVKRIAGRRYVNLDDATVLAAAQSDPAGFLAGFPGPVVLDEVQKAPELFPAIKAVVDRKRRAGRFLLTGSTDVMLLPRLSESLAGRMEVLGLRPFSQGEMEGEREGFVDAVLARRMAIPPKGDLSRRELMDRVVRGGYPEIQRRRSAARRTAWFGAYLTAILQRDVRDIANIEGLSALPRLLGLLAARSTGTLNVADLSRATALPHSTLKRYLGLLSATFLVDTVPAWSGNLGKRLVRSPKVYLSDTGLICSLVGLGVPRLAREPSLFGPLLEAFVMLELRKQTAWSRLRPNLLHFRTQTGQEVDLVLEDPAGRLAGIEVKAGATIRAEDFRGLRVLQEAVGERFVRGVVLYTGNEPVSFGSRLLALPVESVWRLGARPTATPRPGR